MTAITRREKAILNDILLLFVNDDDLMVKVLLEKLRYVPTERVVVPRREVKLVNVRHGLRRVKVGGRLKKGPNRGLKGKNENERDTAEEEAEDWDSLLRSVGRGS